MKRALVTGSFDPPTKGHLELIRRATHLFDEVVVCLFRNENKTYLFSEECRFSMLSAMVKREGFSDVRVDCSDGYVADYAKEHGIGYVIRGVRDEKDMAYEAEMARYNAKRNPCLETLLLVPSDTIVGISSTEARKRLLNHENVSDFLTEEVAQLAFDCLAMGKSSTERE